MEIDTNIIENIVIDFRKKDINPSQKAELVKAVMKEKKLSLRAFCKEFDIPKTTVNNWLKWGLLSPEKIKKYEEQGYTRTEIWEGLKIANKYTQIVIQHSIDYELRLSCQRLEKGIKLKNIKTEETARLLNRLQKCITDIGSGSYLK